MNVITGAVIVFFGILLACQDIAHSLDCIGGVQAACVTVHSRYTETTP